MKNYPLNTVDCYEDFKTLIDKIREKYQDAAAISSYNDAGELRAKTYSELTADVYALAEELLDRGLAGKHIAIVSQNSYMFAAALLSVAYIGGVAVPIDVEQPYEIIKSMASFADCELIFISDSVLDDIEGEDIFDGKPIIILSDSEGIDNGFYGMVDRGNKLIAERGRKSEGITVAPSSTAMIVYTSGTASVSKPVMLSHLALLTNACESARLIASPGRIFSSLPMYHIYGFTCALLNSLINGAEICVNGDIRFMLRDLTLFKPAGIMAVPLIAEMICKRLVDVAEGENKQVGTGLFLFGKKAASETLKPDAKLVAVKEQLFPGLEMMICGGAHLSENISKTLYRFGILLLEGYGITECAPIISANRNEFYKMGTVGIVLPSYEIKIEDGEILVKGKCLMSGYYKQEEMTREAIVDGWYKTGDLGYIDNSGFLVITGRKKNIIVLKNGKKVSPEELENILGAVPMIKEAMVYGSSVGNVADDVVPAVTIYPDPNQTRGMAAYEILSELQNAIDLINEGLPAFKQIRLINIRENEFVKTSTKKIKRVK